MKFFFIALTVLLLSTNSVFTASEARPILKRSFSYGGKSGKLVHTTSENGIGQETLYFNSEKVVTYDFDSDMMRTSLNSMELLMSKTRDIRNAYLIMTWVKGTHSQTIEVWSLPEMKKVWEKSSYYEGFYERKVNELHITYSEDAQPHPKEVTKVFKFVPVRKN